jgi:hypothetical protein
MNSAKTNMEQVILYLIRIIVSFPKSLWKMNERTSHAIRLSFPAWPVFLGHVMSLCYSIAHSQSNHDGSDRHTTRWLEPTGSFRNTGRSTLALNLFKKRGLSAEETWMLFTGIVGLTVKIPQIYIPRTGFPASGTYT